MSHQIPEDLEKKSLWHFSLRGELTARNRRIGPTASQLQGCL
jgi:hypothetical protein